MTKLLKDSIGKKLLYKYLDYLERVKGFNRKHFIEITSSFNKLELKDRTYLYAKAIHESLYSGYEENIDILDMMLSDLDLKGFEVWPISSYLELYYEGSIQKSYKLICNITERSTAEFCLRVILNKDFKNNSKILEKLVRSKNFHHRRLVSEVLRPKLPWAKKLMELENNHLLSLPYLELLKDDEELYVRKSVANHLNDLSKYNPGFVVNTLYDWNKKAPDKYKERISWITKHALRTLIKRGDQSALKLIGVKGKSKVFIKEFKLSNTNISIGESLSFSFKLSLKERSKQVLVVDYIISFVKKDGSLNKKVFKLKKVDAEPLEGIYFKKKHSFRPITTMKYYPGLHKISIQVNGVILKEITFKLSKG